MRQRLEEESLLQIDRLEVGPVEVEARRITCPYRVVRRAAQDFEGEDETTELVYRFEEDVFDPSEEASHNLAAMITAQVALNYGLFCRQIVFHGAFDEADRKFLQEMAANTAREIYVLKLLQPNPFLRPSFLERAALVPTRCESYLQAEISFPQPPSAPAKPWAVRSEGHAVLSSGGKDSLLSFGLLNEMGRETHSLFVNESGRHWYSALNGYRHFQRLRPETTGRVWTTSDRVFSWMLRRLPLVRQDFAKLRADEYPIRLWTVAVFLFGALPVMRKRGLGRLVIGDEFDTTRRVRHGDIPHYDGLYDQSRFFDDALSRYFQTKGWGVHQLSLLRPLSELLIQKILGSRYPELHRQQISCHAAHLEDERVFPCGKCEKCRRIVAMHLALGLDPGRCGYDPEKVEESRRLLATRGVHQESAGAEQLAWMLLEKGVLDEGQAVGKARQHPEILQLRFHPDASPPEFVPRDLRKALFILFLEHAAGAVRRMGRAWQPVDALSDEILLPPSRFEGRREGDAEAPKEASSTLRNGVLWGELSWPLIKQRLRRTDTALLPVGAIEQHGHHLPLDIDSWDAEYLCRKVAEQCSQPQPLVLPLIPYGVSYHHLDFPGTLSVSPDTLIRMVVDVGMSAARHGIRKLVIINGHGGNAPTLQVAAQLINRDAHIFTCVDTGETSDADIDALAETSNDVHAGEIETSTALATRPELVDMSQAQRGMPKLSDRYLDFSSENGVEWFTRTAKISPSGVLGDPTRATREKGEAMWKLMIDHLVRFLDNLKDLSLDEIYERWH